MSLNENIFVNTLLQEMMMVQLKEVYPDLKLGQYFHNVGSMHLYDRHFEMASKIIDDMQVLEMPMIPMDTCNDVILTCLVGIEAAWQAAGAPTDFDFAKVPAWNLLTPYWQNLVLMCFAEDEEALHYIFGLQDHE